ncbi:hypothetical protein PISMIDRAFT_18080 [Pisolithus microcarpus 441]|uniref:Unplaced genomic scaffold scaffold_320, whole genome shotgun sequence n=1 Tax=Pisolithus microcarpus 441 TaxID=765257 RepID=A0A0C9YZM9_9AGAM|nr:hypothetical protein PISMIDRAFT_18080 [Pisolithus microcarpus 441]
MSMTKTTPSTAPAYVLPNLACAAMPGMWATNMAKLEALLEEMLKVDGDEEVVCGWLGSYEELSVSMENLHGYTHNMSTMVPEYSESAQSMLQGALPALLAIQNWFPKHMAKTKMKTMQPMPSATQVSSEVRQSQCQLEKAAAVGEEPKDTAHSNESTTIEGEAASPCEVSGPEQGQDLVIERPTDVTQGLGGGDKSALKVSQGADEPCEQCVK